MNPRALSLYLLLFAAAAGTGIALRPHNPAGSATGPASPASKAADRTSGPASARVFDPFEAILGRDSTRSENDDPLLHPALVELTSWSVADMQRALDEAITSPDATAEDSPNGKAVRELIRAWMGKDLDSFLAWFSGMKSEVMRGQLSGWVNDFWPENRAEDGVRFVIAHPGFFRARGIPLCGDMIQRGLESSAMKGAASLIGDLEALEACGMNLTSTPFNSFPPGFDFAGLSRSEQGQKLLSSHPEVVNGWLKQQRDQAFQELIALSAKSGKPLEAFLTPIDGIQIPAPDPELAGWLAGKLGTLADPGNRQRAIKEEVAYLIAAPESLARFAESLPDPEDRKSAHTQAALGIDAMGAAASIAHLEALENPADRIEALLQLEPYPRRTSGGRIQSPEEIEMIARKLREWNATPEQIDEIIGHLSSTVW